MFEPAPLIDLSAVPAAEDPAPEPPPAYSQPIYTPPPERAAPPPPPLAPLAPPQPPASSLDAGVALVWSGLAAATGAAVAGAWGALAGLALVGAARNGYRAGELWPTQSSEATRSATLAVFGVGAAALALAQAFSRKKDE